MIVENFMSNLSLKGLDEAVGQCIILSIIVGIIFGPS